MPREVYSEIDASRREVRKVEVFADGRYGFASSSLSRGSTQLGLEPLPPVEEIAREKEFNLRRGTAVEFEEMWKRAGGGR